jgi:hypothetical protein
MGVAWIVPIVSAVEIEREKKARQRVLTDSVTHARSLPFIHGMMHHCNEGTGLLDDQNSVVQGIVVVSQ